LFGSTADSVELASRGTQWVRSHPFTVNALTEFPVDMQKYKEVGFTSVMAYVSKANPTYIEQMVGNTQLDWHWFCGSANMKNDQWILQAVKDLRAKYPGNIGLSIGDESASKEHPRLGKLMEEIRKLAPDALVYHPVISMDGAACNPEAYSGTYDKYLDDAVSVLKPDVLMVDPYPFYQGQTASNYLENLAIVRQKALKANIPYWIWAQSHGMSPAGPFQEPSESEMRFQAYAALAYGFTGISYWTYASSYKPYTNAMVDGNGQPTHMYKTAVGLVPELKNLGERLKCLTSTGVYYEPGRIQVDNQWVSLLPAGTVHWSPEADARIKAIKVPDGARGFLLGMFKDDAGEDYLMLVNTNHAAGKDAASTAEAVSIQFSDQVTALERIDRSSGQAISVPLSEHALNHYVLPGGTGDLFKFPIDKPAPTPDKNAEK
jgi:hypothetical protein